MNDSFPYVNIESEKAGYEYRVSEQWLMSRPEQRPAYRYDPRNDMNSGPGWYEVIHPTSATTEIVRVMEDGSIYCPEGVLTRDEFAFAAARGKVYLLVRAYDHISEVMMPFRVADLARFKYKGDAELYAEGISTTERTYSVETE